MEQAGQTIDNVKRYGLQIAQPESGYRFSLDALLLADFVKTRDDARIADLGTGCGVIPLILCKRYSAAKIVGIESNISMAELSRENFARNELTDRIITIAADIVDVRSKFPVSSFDGVVSNPPFRSPVSGRLSPKLGRDTARHESTASIPEFLSAAKYLVKPSGRMWFIYHPDRLVEFIQCAGEQKLAVMRLRMVHGSNVAPAKMFMVELAKGRKGTTAILPPLMVYDDKGDYTCEASQILSG